MPAGGEPTARGEPPDAARPRGGVVRVAFWFELTAYRLWGDRGWFGLNYFRMFWTSGKQRVWGKGRLMSGTKKKSTSWLVTLILY